MKWLVQSCSEQFKFRKKTLSCALAHPKRVVKYFHFYILIKITKYFNEIYCTIYTSASPKLYGISTITDISTLKYANNPFYELHQIGDKSWVTHFHAKTKQYSIPQNPFRYHYHPSFTTSIFGGDITNSMFDLENSRSRTQSRSHPMVAFEAQSSINMFAFCFVAIGPFWLRYSKFHIWPWKFKVKVTRSGSIIMPKMKEIRKVVQKLSREQKSAAGGGVRTGTKT